MEKGLTKFKEEENKELEVIERDVIEKIMSRFRLDTRSDPVILDGLTLEGVRRIYHEAAGGEPMRGIQPRNSNTAIFLLADAQVLQDPGLRLFKVADADHDPIAAVPRNTRVQRNFGWIVIPTIAILEFYYWMDIFTFEETCLGEGSFWDPEKELC